MMFGARRFQQFFRYASGRNMSLALSRMGENPSMKYYLTPFLGIIVGGALLGATSTQVEAESTTEKFNDLKNILERIERKITPVNEERLVDVVLGAQWGDEGVVSSFFNDLSKGKGKLVDILSGQYDVCARVAGGSNAGHTIVAKGKTYKFHLIPSGILHPGTTCVIGNGVVVHIPSLIKELRLLKEAGVDYEGRIFLSDRAHLVFDFHQQADGMQETLLAAAKLGTTGKGIGPAYSSKAARNGVRAGDLANMKYFETRLRGLARQMVIAYPSLNIDIDAELRYYESVRDVICAMTIDTVAYVNEAHEKGKRILVEGANATMLDLDFGTYPYVTSSNPSIGSVCTGLGISPMKIGHITGIVKAYCTRVGEGPFPTELKNEMGEHLRKVGVEFGTTTGRPRRCGWIDIPQLRYAHLINGFTSINLTKLDVLTGLDEVKIGVEYVKVMPDGSRKKIAMPSSLEVYSSIVTEYETLPGWKEDISKAQKFEDLPVNCQNYVLRLEELLGVPIKWIGVGPGREDVISR